MEVIWWVFDNGGGVFVVVNVKQGEEKRTRRAKVLTVVLMLVMGDKGKGIMIEPEVPLKRKDQIALDEQIARDIQAKLNAELLEEQKLARKQEEEANIALIESWENTQALMEADRLLAKRLQSKEREELIDEEKAKLFMELMEKRRKHFAALRAQEKRNRPPTKAQKRTQMSTYLKHMAMGSKVQESKEKKEEVEEEKESAEFDEVELKKLLVIKKVQDIAIDAIPLATKLPVIIDYKLHKEGIEDLEALWRIVKAKYGDTSLENEFERVLYGDLKVMFEPNIKSDIWRMLQGHRVTIWKLIDSFGVHFVRFTIYKMRKGCYVWSSKYIVNTDDFMNPLPKGWSIRSIVWSIILGEMEEDSFLIINLSAKVVQYNLISKTLREIYDMGSNEIADDYLHGFIPPYAIINSRKYTIKNSFTLGSTEEADKVKILQSCNGLLLCTGSRRNAFDYVYSPSTNMLKILLEPDYTNVDSNVYGCTGLRYDFGSSEFTIYEMMKGSFVWSVTYHVDTDDFMTPLLKG
ncbi:hypothetical protein Tco_0146430 [Tanacetum coccineum]